MSCTGEPTHTQEAPARAHHNNSAISWRAERHWLLEETNHLDMLSQASATATMMRCGYLRHAIPTGRHFSDLLAGLHGQPLPVLLPYVCKTSGQSANTSATCSSTRGYYWPAASV